MAAITVKTVKDTERENIRRCMEEYPDPIGAKNWKVSDSLICDIKELKKLNIYGVIVGKAIYSGYINLKEAIDLCKINS